MNKKTAADIDPRSIAVDFFRKLGGMDGMTKWGKTHRSHAYSLIAKLLAQPLVQNVAVNVINDGEAARRKLEDAFLQLIESRKYEGVDPAVFIITSGSLSINRVMAFHIPHPRSPRLMQRDPRLMTRKVGRPTTDPRLMRRHPRLPLRDLFNLTCPVRVLEPRSMGLTITDRRLRST
jgi:hypothetical protein